MHGEPAEQHPGLFSGIMHRLDGHVCQASGFIQTGLLNLSGGRTAERGAAFREDLRKRTPALSWNLFQEPFSVNFITAQEQQPLRPARDRPLRE